MKPAAAPVEAADVIGHCRGPVNAAPGSAFAGDLRQRPGAKRRDLGSLGAAYRADQPVGLIGREPDVEQSRQPPLHEIASDQRIAGQGYALAGAPLPPALLGVTRMLTTPIRGPADLFTLLTFGRPARERGPRAPMRAVPQSGEGDIARGGTCGRFAQGRSPRASRPSIAHRMGTRSATPSIT